MHDLFEPVSRTKIDEINKVAADKGWDVTRADL